MAGSIWGNLASGNVKLMVCNRVSLCANHQIIWSFFFFFKNDLRQRCVCLALGWNFMIFCRVFFVTIHFFCGFCNRTVSCQSRGDFSQTPALLRLGANGPFPFHAHATRAMWFHKFYTKSMHALERFNFDFCCTTYLRVLHLSDWSIS